MFSRSQPHDASLDAEELDAIYREAPIGLALLDKDMHYLKVNRALAELNGVAAADHIGRTVAEVVPGLAPIVEPHFRSVFETGVPNDFEVSGETPKLPGVRRTWLEKISPALRRGGEVRAVLVAVIEITEQKRAEQRLQELAAKEQMLMRELSHRISNGLTLVSSLLDLEARAARSDESRAAFQSASGRVRGLGVIHRHLYSRDDPQLVSDVGRYLNALCADLGRAFLHGTTIAVEADPKLTLVADRMIPLGILVSELVMNAFKHAGKPMVDIAVAAGCENGRGFLVVSDDGAGIPEGFDPKASRGIGMTVVRSQVAQLGGTLSVGRGPAGGASFRVDFPLG